MASIVDTLGSKPTMRGGFRPTFTFAKAFYAGITRRGSHLGWLSDFL